MPLVLQLWMFASPVVYPLSAVPERLRGLYLLNPMAGVIENFRRAILQGEPPDFRTLGISALIAVVLLPVAYIYFKRVEATAPDISGGDGPARRSLKRRSVNGEPRSANCEMPKREP